MNTQDDYHLTTKCGATASQSVTKSCPNQQHCTQVFVGKKSSFISQTNTND